MFKQILFSLWVCGASLAGATATDFGFLPDLAGKASGMHEQDADLISLTYGSTKLLSAPQIADGQISGYVLAMFTFGTEGSYGDEEPSDGPSALIADAFNTVVARGGLDVTESGWIANVDEITAKVRQAVNTIPDSDPVWRLYVTQMDYLSKDDIRANSAARREAIRNQ